MAYHPAVDVDDAKDNRLRALVRDKIRRRIVDGRVPPGAHRPASHPRPEERSQRPERTNRRAPEHRRDDRTLAEVLPETASDQVREILRDPYDLDFLALDPSHSERDLRDALVDRLTYSRAELGAGFAFVGRQFRLNVGERVVFLDLLFYHLGLRRFVVFELKYRAAGPEHSDRLNSYARMVDNQLRRPEHGDGSTIGILLAASRDDVVGEYVLRGLTGPMADSTFTTHRALPDDVRAALPTRETWPRSSGTPTSPPTGNGKRDGSAPLAPGREFRTVQRSAVRAVSAAGST